MNVVDHIKTYIRVYTLYYVHCKYILINYTFEIKLYSWEIDHGVCILSIKDSKHHFG